MEEFIYIVSKYIDYAFSKIFDNKEYYLKHKEFILFVYSFLTTLLLIFAGIFNYLKFNKTSKKTTSVIVEQFSQNSDEHGHNKKPLFLNKSINNISITYDDNKTPVSGSAENSDDNKVSIFLNNDSYFSEPFQTTTRMQSAITTNEHSTDKNGDDDKMYLLLNKFNNSINHICINAEEKKEILRLRNDILVKLNNQVSAWFLRYFDRINFENHFMNIQRDKEFIINYRNLSSSQKLSIENYMQYMRTICRTEYCFAKSQEYGYLTFKTCKALNC
jgi:hypothetical protein